MSVTVFTIFFLFMAVGMITLLLLNTRKVCVVKAGKVTKFCKGRRFVYCGDVDVNGDSRMLVAGNSMQAYGIHDGQVVFVKRFKDNEKKEISAYPVIVFSIADRPDKSDAGYKMRKFVGYTYGESLDSLYDKYIARIKVPKNEFISQCEKKYARICTLTPDAVLSETYDEMNDKVLYSLNPVDLLYGKVEYAM